MKISEKESYYEIIVDNDNEVSYLSNMFYKYSKGFVSVEHHTKYMIRKYEGKKSFMLQKDTRILNEINFLFREQKLKRILNENR